MADSRALWLVAGVLGGATITLGVVLLIDKQKILSKPGGPATLTEHTVVRDDQGRIQTVETLSGLPLGNAGPPAVGGEPIMIDDR